MAATNTSTTPATLILPSSVSIVIGITTIPERLSKGLLAKSLQSLLAQDTLANIAAIVVNIPAISLKGKAYDKAAALALMKLHPKIIVQYGVLDMGPITKLVPTLGYVDQMFAGKTNGAALANDVWIALADDDTVYSPNILMNLFAQTQLTDAAVGFAGRSGVASLYHHGVSQRAEVTFLETFAGVIYKRGTFGPLPAFTEWLKTLPADAAFVDDIVIGAWMNKHNVRMFVVPLGPQVQGVAGSTVAHDAADTPQLRNGNLFERNIKVLRSLQAAGYFPELNPKDVLGHVVMAAVDTTYGTLNNMQNTIGAIGHFFNTAFQPPKNAVDKTTSA